MIEMKNDVYRVDDDAQVTRRKDHNAKPLWSIIAGKDGRDEQILNSDLPMLRHDKISSSLPFHAAFPCGRRGSAVSSRSLSSRLTLLARANFAVDARQPSGETTGASSRGPMRRRTAGIRTHDFSRVYILVAICQKEDLEVCWKGILNVGAVFALAVRKWKESVLKRKECRKRKSTEFITQDADTMAKNRLICFPRYSGIRRPRIMT